ncbi:uncharacterized protein EV422DRAFT_565448 [Fimicolochytrium jonesii]|uniref:uncharacterized protein n=1 Tax=Fimicolochytrium jonesii TaxID=1396493 RepID=UPI0022FDC83F|nr:uncharacterized protein EV422DRAFT_565448 [Fimicolochytrium jonesii]KAI8823502.1 hypothetical protein EV422DRAFT_565448 [Fimicolochytrium jonesii]
MSSKFAAHVESKPIRDIYHFKESYFGGVPEFNWTLEEYEKKHMEHKCLTENFTKLGANDKIKLFVDFDLRFEEESDLPSEEVETEIRKGVDKVFTSLYLNEDITFHSAFRTMGYAPKHTKDKNGKYVETGGGYKVSYRLWADGMYTTRNEMKKKLKKFIPDLSDFPDVVRDYNFKDGFFDLSVYDNNRSMVMVDKVKNRWDNRLLIKSEPDAPISSYIIQYVEADWTPVEWTIQSDSRKRPANDEFVLVPDSDLEDQPQPKKKKVTPSRGEENVTSIAHDIIRKHYPNAYLLRDLSEAKILDHAVTVFVKGKYCMVEKADHEVSVSKMYFTLTTKRLKFNCTHCNGTRNSEHGDKRLDECFDNDVEIVKPGERLSIKRAAQVYKTHDYEGVIMYLNNYWAKVTEESSVFIASRTTIDSPWLLRKPSEFESAFGHLKFTYLEESLGNDGKTTYTQQVFPLVANWKIDNKMRTFRHVKFRPDHVGDHEDEYLNLFQGFQGKKLLAFDEAKFKLLLDHAKNILCSGDEEFYSYLIHWLAHIVQFPGQKTQTAPVFFSKQGTGKNIFFDFFAKFIIGTAHSFYTNDIDQVTGRFNAAQAVCIFMVCDEVTFAGAHKQNNKLKSIITSAQTALERKGRDIIMVDSCLNAVFLSNNEDAMRIENTCRRYGVKRAASSRIGDEVYFKTLGAHLTQEVADHFYTYLLSLDLSDFNARKVPDTEEKREMAGYSRSPLDLFIDDILAGNIAYKVVNGHFVEEDMESKWVPGHTEYFELGVSYDLTMNELFDLFTTFCKTEQGGRVESKLTKAIFSKRIRRILNIENRLCNRRGGTPITMVLERIDTE